MEGNWYSLPAALVCQNLMVQIPDQLLIRQVIAGLRAGLVPQRAIEAAPENSAAAVVELDAVQSSSLAGQMSDYAAVVAEMG